MPPLSSSPVHSQPQRFSTSPGLARSASLLALGAVASRALGLLRDMVITGYFGASGLVSAFTVANNVPAMLYDLLIGGMLSAALVPVLSDYARPERRLELVRLMGALLSLAAVTLAGLVVMLALFAPQVARLLAGGFAELDPELLPLTARLVRFIAPTVWFFSMGGLLIGILYALQRFSLPAIATAIYNLGIVMAALLLAERVGIVSLAVGVLAGSMVQFGLMAWDVRRAGLRLSVQWSHPALARIVRLYLPIAGGLIVAQMQVALDRRLASGTGAQSIAWMHYATTLQQLPLGMISVAISLAALPRLSQQFAAGDESAYRQTLAGGLRMVFALIAPVLVGLWLLAEPTVRLLFQRGPFTPGDTAHVVMALRVYLYGALFAAIDFPLIYAFYARNNTLLPALVGVLSALVYGVIALALIEGLGFLGLVWADTAKQAAHALVMLALLSWRVGFPHLPRRPVSLPGGQAGGLPWGLGRTVLSVGGAAGAMAVVMVVLMAQFNAAGLPAWATDLLPAWATDLLQIAVVGGVGALVYAGGLLAVGQPEARQIGRLAWERWGR